MYNQTKKNSATIDALQGVCLLLLATVMLASCVPASPRGTSSATGSVEIADVPTINEIQLQVEVTAPNSAEIARVDGQTMIVFHSPKGIGEAQITLPKGMVNNPLTLRFQLDGLEQLRVRTPSMLLAASLSAIEENLAVQEMGSIESAEVTPQKMEALTTESPYWLEIDVSKAASASAADGFIDVTLPQALLSEVDSAMTVEWIDFYR